MSAGDLFLAVFLGYLAATSVVLLGGFLWGLFWSYVAYRKMAKLPGFGSALGGEALHDYMTGPCPVCAENSSLPHRPGCPLDPCPSTPPSPLPPFPLPSEEA